MVIRTCSLCAEPATVRYHGTHCCTPHYRIKQMRYKAQDKGKTVPSVAELEAMIAALQSRGMKCEACNVTMNMLTKDGWKTVVTLQHDRDGTHRLICHVCNTRHAIHPGDSYYSLAAEQRLNPPAGRKLCGKCKAVKLVKMFNKDARCPSGLRSRCRKCQSTDNANYGKTRRRAVARR